MTVTVSDPQGTAGQTPVWETGRYYYRTPQVLDLAENPTYRLTLDGTTDMTSRVQAAFTDAGSAVTADSGPVEVKLPNGRIMVSTTVRIPHSGLHVKGAGGLFNQNGTQFVKTGDMQLPVFDSDPANYLSNCVMEDFSIEANALFPPLTGTGHAFQLYGVGNNSSFRRIHVSRLTGDTFHIETQTLNPSDDTSTYNLVFEQIFSSTNGGYGIYTDGYNKFVAIMNDFNGNRAGDYYFANGVSNQAGITILGHGHESGGSVPSTTPVILDNMDNQPIVFLNSTWSGPVTGTAVCTIQGATGAKPVFWPYNGFGYTNLINDTVNSVVIPFSSGSAYLGMLAKMAQLEVQGIAPLIDIVDQNGTTDQQYFRWQIASGKLQLLSRLDDASANATLMEFAAGGTISTPNSLRVSGNIGVGNSASASSLGTVTKKIQIYDASGASLGFVPVYDAIT